MSIWAQCRLLPLETPHKQEHVFLSQQQWAGRTEAGGDGEDVEGGPAGESQTGGESSEYH